MIDKGVKVKEIRPRRKNWDDGEVRKFLDLCGDDRVQGNVKVVGHNVSVYQHISDRLNRALSKGAEAGSAE